MRGRLSWRHLKDREDYYLAVDAVQDLGRVYTPDEAKRELEL